MSKKITIYDVAQQAGVAISTVSRVLNKSPYVSDDTKDKVLKAIKELQFRPQVNARKLASKEAQTLSIAVPTFTTPFFNEILKGVKDELNHLDLDFIIYNLGSQNSKANLLKFLDRGTPDAFMIFSIEIDEEIDEILKSLNIPIILVDTKHADYDYFYWDNFKGGYLAGQHLARQGFLNIGLINSMVNSGFIKERERGFMQAMYDYKIKIPANNIVSGITKKHSGFSEEAGYEAVQILSKQTDKMPEALFCANDTIAIGALHAIEELNLKVPDDIALVGYDNIKISHFVGLSTIDQKMYEVGMNAVKRLSERIRRKELPLEQRIIDPELIKRKSTNKKIL
ncbi:LacI family transcriptional regulator [bacterium]|nr:MAG: LacI family transcriptional regulator [bacterium]